LFFELRNLTTCHAFGIVSKLLMSRAWMEVVLCLDLGCESYGILNIFYKKINKMKINIFREIGAHFWWYWIDLNDWDFLEAVLQLKNQWCEKYSNLGINSKEKLVGVFVHVWANDTCHTSEFQKGPKVWQGMRWKELHFYNYLNLTKNDKFIFIKFYILIIH
jgi:hypothetical protein